MDNNINGTGAELVPDTAGSLVSEPDENSGTESVQSEIETTEESTKNESDTETPETDTDELTEEIPPKKNLIQKIKEKIIDIGYEGTIVRLLISWIMVSGYEIISAEYKFTTFEFFNDIKMWFYLLMAAVVFAVLTFIHNSKLDKILLFFSAIVYSTFAVAQDNKFYFTAGTCIFMGSIAVYCVGDWIKVRLKKLPTIITIAVFGLIFTLFVGLLTAFRYIQHWTPCYDFGIFAQMFDYMKDTFQPLTTCERDKVLSHFAVHFSPVYYLLLPFYYIFPTPVTLLIGQAAIVASGLIPLYLLCKKYQLSNNATVLFALVYVLLPSMANGCFYYLHENKFLTAIILWLAYALEKNKWVPTIIATFFLLSVKEDAPVYAAVLGLYFLISRRRILKGSVVMVISVIYFIIVSYFMAKYGEGTMSYRYDNFIYDGSGSLVTVIKAVILNPIYAIYESFDEEKIKFLLQMLIPLSFMPLMTKKPSRVVLFIPLILINLMSDYKYQHDIDYQYTYGSAAFLFYLMIMNYSELKQGFRSKLLAVTVTSSVLMFTCNTYHRINNYKSYMRDLKNGSIEVIDEALELVPEDASVAATTFLVPNLFNHKELYEFESTEHREDVEYIVMDLRYSSDEFSPYDYANNPVYETVTIIPEKIAIFRNTTISDN